MRLNKKGGSHIKTVVLVLGVSMTLSAVLTYASCMTRVQTVRDAMRRALDSLVTADSVRIYESVKQGSDYTASLAEEELQSKISALLPLDFDEEFGYVWDEQGNVLYRLTVPRLVWETENTLRLHVDYELLLPVEFAGLPVTTIRIQQRVTSYFTPRK